MGERSLDIAAYALDQPLERRVSRHVGEQDDGIGEVADRGGPHRPRPRPAVGVPTANDSCRVYRASSASYAANSTTNGVTPRARA